MKWFWVIVMALATVMGGASAVPTFQVYMEDAWAGANGGDENTWFSNKSPFSLVVVGNFSDGSKRVALTNVVLVASVPHDKIGSITVDGGVMTGEFDAKEEFLPLDFNPNEHFPFTNDASDFLVVALGDLTTYDSGVPVSASAYPVIHDYDADRGLITEGGHGVERSYEVEVSGYGSAHFDVYGLVEEWKETGGLSKHWVLNGEAWEINPGSHDSTFHAPAPGAIVLGSFGIGLVGWLRRRKTV